MLINLPDPEVVKPLLQRKSLTPDQIYLSNGQRFGSSKRLGNEPLVVLETVEQAGFIGRAWDTVRLWVK